MKLRPVRPKALVAFGKKAKGHYVELSEARDLAASLPGVMLRGQTDSSQGMVGALAGAGLRLGGEDGRFRGKWDLTPFARQAIYGDTPVATIHDCVGLFPTRESMCALSICGETFLTTMMS